MLGLLRVIFICGFLLAICTPARAEDAPPQVGAYAFTGTTLSLLGDEAASNFEDIIPKDEDISWQVYVPETYSPDKPAGLVIYISPSNSGVLPEAWSATLKDQNLIWVSANNSGNKID